MAGFFLNVKNSKGNTSDGDQGGKDGITPDIQIGTIATLEPGQQATVTREGTNENPIFNFGIPRGDIGEPGEKGVDGIDGKSLEFNWNGTKLGVRQEGTSDYQYVNLKGERGLTGEKGERGEQGLPGKDGISPDMSDFEDKINKQYESIKAKVDKIEQEDIPVEIPIVGDTLTLTTVKRQKANMKNNTTIALPVVDEFTEIHLTFNTTEALTLTLPRIKWQGDINIEANKTYEFIFTYINNNWLGGYVSYNEQKVINEQLF